MSIATLLLTGAALPYHVIDYAINWAKDNEGSLRALFLVPGKMPEEGYPFPNDLDEAEEITGRRDAEKGIKNIVQEEIRFIEKRCQASHIPLQPEVMFSPGVQKVVSKVNDSDLVFVDRNAEDNENDMNNLPFRLEDVKDKTSRHFISVGEMDRYSDIFY
jgi:hypothetical protein